MPSAYLAAGVPEAINPVIIGKIAEKGDLSSLNDLKLPAASVSVAAGTSGS